jgi:hypothetical protein
MIDPGELHAFADGQLDKADHDRISRELELDAVSRAEVDSIIAIKTFVGTHAKVISCSDEWQACRARLAEIDKVLKPESLITRFAWAICGVFFVAILAGGILNRTVGAGGRSGNGELAQIVASMTPAGSANTGEPRELRKWLDTMVGQAAASVDPQRLDVLNRSYAEFDGKRAVRLGLRDASGDLSLVVIDGDVNLEELPASNVEPYRTGQLQSTNFIAWHEHGDTFLLSGARPFDQLIQTVETKITR